MDFRSDFNSCDENVTTLKSYDELSVTYVQSKFYLFLLLLVSTVFFHDILLSIYLQSFAKLAQF